jgi:hypothetical protein
VIWRDESSAVGRAWLARALLNLGKMMFVHFGGAFDGLVSFIETDPDRCLVYVFD